MTKKELKSILIEKSKSLSEEELSYLKEEIKSIDLGSPDWDKVISLYENKQKVENKYNILSLYLLGISDYPKKLEHRWELADVADIDLDFSPDGRDRIKEYLKQKYGEDNCVSIGTYGTLGVKGSFQEICRVYNIPPKEYISISKLLTDDMKDLDIDEIKELVPQLKKFLEKYKEISDAITKLTGVKKSIGSHAGGFVVSSDSVVDNIPIVKSSKTWVTGWQESGAIKELEALGFIKVDILGLSAVEQIRQTVNEVKKRHKNVKLPEDIYDVDVNDPNVYDFINTLELDNIFQMESKVFVDAVKKIKPRKLSDISNISTLIRPGAACTVEEYAKSVMDKTKTPKCLWDVFYHTRGWLIYQEQLMQVLMILGGFNIFDADKVRRLIRKIGKSKTSDENRKEMVENLDVIYNEYIKNAIKKITTEDGWNENKAEEYSKSQWDAILGQAKYSFNMPHSYAYSLIGYVQAWFKTYFPVEFWVATLNTIDRGREKYNQSSLGRYIYKINKSGIVVKKPDVNRSDVNFIADGDDIYFALSYIKDIGNSSAVVVENRSYKNWGDFLQKAKSKKINKRVVKALIFSGALDFDEDVLKRNDKWNEYCKKEEKVEFNYHKLIEIEYDYCKYSFTGVPKFILEKNTGSRLVSEFDYSKKLASVIGYVEDIANKKSKKSGNNYILLTITDFRSSISIFVFGAENKEYISNNIKKGDFVKVVVENDDRWLKLPMFKNHGLDRPIKVIKET